MHFREPVQYEAEEGGVSMTAPLLYPACPEEWPPASHHITEKQQSVTATDSK